MGQTQQCASLLVLRTWLLQVWRTLPIFAQDLTKKIRKKKQASHSVGVSFFSAVRFAWTAAGDGERGLSNRAQHQKWLPEMLDCWFLMHVGWTTCSFWNVALLSSIHLPCTIIIIMVTIFGPGGLKRLRSNLVKHVNFAAWCLLKSYLTRSPAQSPKSSPSKMCPPFCTPFELASPPGPLEKTRCTCKSTHLPQENPSHPQTHAHIHTYIYIYIIHVSLILHRYVIYTCIYKYIIYTYIFIHTQHSPNHFCVLAGSWPWNCSISRISSGLGRVCRWLGGGIWTPLVMVGKHKTSVVNMLGLPPNPGSQWINVNNIYSLGYNLI